MKRFFICLIGLIIFPLTVCAVELDLGIDFGIRTLSNESLKNSYGSGLAINPVLKLNIFSGLFAGITMETGYSKDAKIGVYQEDSTFKISGFEFYAGYEKKFKSIAPFARLGYGSFKIKQEITSDYISGFSKTKGTLTLAAGLKFFLIENIFLQTIVSYNSLKLKPFDAEINCGGLKLQAGFGYRFKL